MRAGDAEFYISSGRIPARSWAYGGLLEHWMLADAEEQEDCRWALAVGGLGLRREPPARPTGIAARWGASPLIGTVTSVYRVGIVAIGKGESLVVSRLLAGYPCLGESRVSRAIHSPSPRISMGSTFFGIPCELTVLLAKAGGCSVFVETGTFRGETTRWASSHFARVETVEVFEKYYRLSRKGLADCQNVVVHHGSSLEHLPSLIDSLGSERALYWLDAHKTAESKCESQECPLLAELDLLQHRPFDIVMIDDARLFLTVPPSPADPAQWPTISEVLAKLDLPGNRRYVQIIDDVIVAVPLGSPATPVLRDYAQSLVTRRLHEGGSLPRRFVRRLGSLVRH